MVEVVKRSRHENRWLGYGLEGQTLDDFLQHSSSLIRTDWDQIYARAEGRPLSIVDYQKASSMSYFAANVIKTAVSWHLFGNEEKKRAAKDILSHQVLKYTLSAVNRLSAHSDNTGFNPLEAVQNGLLFAWEHWQNVGHNSFPASIHSHLHHRYIDNKPPEVLIRTLDLNNLEEAKFIAANMDEITDPQVKIEAAEFVTNVRGVANTLTPIEQTILKNRWLLEDNETLTLKEIGRQIGVTRERVRQIELKAMRKIRYQMRDRKEFKGYVAEESTEDKLRMYFNGIINAYHFQDGARAGYNLAMAKLTLLENYSSHYIPGRSIIQLFENPQYFQITDDAILQYLGQFTAYSGQILDHIRQIEKMEEFRRFEKMVRKIS